MRTDRQTEIMQHTQDSVDALLDIESDIVSDTQSLLENKES